MHDASTATVDDIEVIDLPRVNNRAGNITAINNSVEVPFDVQRIFYLYDIPSGEARGGHAHAELEELIVAASGSFSVRLNDGKNKRTISINRPDKAIHLKPGVWIELLDFSSGAICLVMASLKYDIEDYILTYDDFIEFKRQ